MAAIARYADGGSTFYTQSLSSTTSNLKKLEIKLDRIKNTVRTDPNEILAFFLQLSLDTFNASEFE